jgi:hypothetical protein
MKIIFAALLLIMVVSVYSCSTTNCGCSVPKKGAQGNPINIQYNDK